MTDIVERLLHEPDSEHDYPLLCAEAADEIERLRHELAELRKSQGEPVAWLAKHTRDVDGLWEDELSLNFNGNGTPLYTSAPSIPEGWYGTINLEAEVAHMKKLGDQLGAVLDDCRKILTPKNNT